MVPIPQKHECNSQAATQYGDGIENGRQTEVQMLVHRLHNIDKQWSRNRRVKSSLRKLHQPKPIGLVAELRGESIGLPKN